MIIPDHVTKAVRSIPIAIVAAKDIVLMKTGNDYKSLCPFHDDSNPSLTLYTKTNTYKCFGCAAYGDVIEWTKKLHNLEFIQAVKKLASEAAIEFPIETRDTELPVRQVNYVLEEAKRIYQHALPKYDKVMRYLKDERGLTDESIQKFELGAVLSGIKDYFKKATTEELKDVGLIRKSNYDAGYYDFFRYRVMFPIRNKAGSLVGFAGRCFADKPDTMKYINSIDSAVFNKSKELYGINHAHGSIRRMNSVIICEGYFDVITSHQHGFTNTIAPMGLALGEYAISEIFKTAQHIVFAYDGDSAGRNTYKRNLPALLQNLTDQHTVKFMKMVDGEDPDSILRIKGAEFYQGLLDNAVSLSDFILDMVLFNKSRDLSPEAKIAHINDFNDVVNHIQSAPIFKHALSKNFSRKIDIPLHFIKSGS